MSTPPPPPPASRDPGREIREGGWAKRPHRCWWVCRVWCGLGLHRWENGPDRPCVCCKAPDDFHFDLGDAA